MSVQALHIAIYGAVADIPPQLARPLPFLAGLKRRLKLQRDLYRFKHSTNFHCDYRDYSVDHASNIGDIAIAETIRLNLRSLNLDTTFSNIDWGDVTRLRNVHAQQKIDLIVIAGGGYFLFNHAGQLPDRLREDLAFFKDSRIPYVFWGVGVNQPFNPHGDRTQPAPTPEGEAGLRAMLDGAELITVRDEYSANFLSGYTQQTVHLVGDPALHVADALALGAVRTKRHGAPVIGLNFPFHGPSSNRFLLGNLAAYARALQTIQQQTGCSFRYITHHACEYVVPRLLRASGIKLDIVHADLIGTCSAYRELDLHIGGMLHSCILSASSGTPWIAIAYDIKHQGFNRLMGMDDYYQDTLSFSEPKLVSLALKALSEQDNLRTRIAERRNELHLWIEKITATALPALH